MSARTLLAAAAGAATGALATAFFFNSRAPAGGFRPPPVTISRTPPAVPGATGRPEAPVDPAGIYQYGFPGPIVDMGNHSAFISGYDRRMRNPAWVAEHITAESLLVDNGDRKNSVFIEDEAVPERFRAKLKDYFRSGYDRGHQAPAADAKWSQSSMDETFLLTNMCPQVGTGFNRDYWAHFEDFCRRLVKHYPSVRIITGPLYLPQRTPEGKWKVEYEVVGNPPNIAVPTHFYKILIGEGKTADGTVAVAAFVMPNQVISNSTPLKTFEVPVEMVERASGLEFLGKLDVAKRRRLCGEVECGILVREFKRAAEGGQQSLGKK
ncbi:mitochondrial nuclease [Tirmania nivea]|nr:mitochondrial nuclease [Tirmania nivea]